MDLICQGISALTLLYPLLIKKKYRKGGSDLWPR